MPDNNLQNNSKIEKLAKDIFNLSAILLEYCRNNTETQEAECIYTGLNILHQKADDLNLKLMGFE